MGSSGCSFLGINDVLLPLPALVRIIILIGIKSYLSLSNIASYSSHSIHKPGCLMLACERARKWYSAGFFFVVLET